MQSNRPQDGRSPFDLFGDFGSSIHGRNPFDDPFFTTRPFDSAFYRSNPVSGSRSVVPPSEPVIQELSSDDDEDGRENEGDEDLKNARRSNEPFVNHPDEESDGGQEDIKYTTGNNRTVSTQPRSFKVTSCKVSYGGVDGVYYSSSSTRRMGSDGVIMEESKEADKSKGEAIHRVSRGLNDKGHSVTRKLNPDGKVDTSETLHNLNEDELGNFEEAWRSNSGNHLSSWTAGTGPQGMDRSSHAFLLPSTTQAQSVPNSERSQGNPSGSRSKKVIRIPIE
ncbi:uncharacterized protein LOC141585999 [Silene latifolia]|uniref:uncharacterized protein LOC141585999 n=1 Tax=Silene latifolia TaxID=37657 RepID=UPI003D783998